MAYFRKRGEKWSFTVDIGVDPETGKRKQKTVSGFADEKEAQKACAALITDIERGQFVDNKDSLKTFLIDFLENQVKTAVSESTYVAQSFYANEHIIPFLGHKKLQHITPMDVQKLYSHLLKKELSPGYIRNIGIFLGKALQSAFEWGMVNRNVVKSVKRPSYTPVEMKVWTTEQVQKFLESSKDKPFFVVYVLALTTGMRIGEIIGLRWRDVNLNDGSISVTQITKYTNRRQYFKKPKSSRSARLITIPNFVVSILRKYKLESPPNDNDLVVTGIYTDIAYQNTVRTHFASDLKEAGMPEIRFHDLRHTHATILLSLGENPKVVQERLGHASITTTLNTYSHVLPTMQKKVADKLNDALNWE